MTEYEFIQCMSTIGLGIAAVGVSIYLDRKNRREQREHDNYMNATLEDFVPVLGEVIEASNQAEEVDRRLKGELAKLNQERGRR